MAEARPLSPAPTTMTSSRAGETGCCVPSMARRKSLVDLIQSITCSISEELVSIRQCALLRVLCVVAARKFPGDSPVGKGVSGNVAVSKQRGCGGGICGLLLLGVGCGDQFGNEGNVTVGPLLQVVGCFLLVFLLACRRRLGLRCMEARINVASTCRERKKESTQGRLKLPTYTRIV